MKATIRWAVVAIVGLGLGWSLRHYIAAIPPAVFSLDDPAPTFGYVTLQQGRPSGTRIYLFHGLRSDHRYWNDKPYRSFTEARLARGDELILVDLPYVEAGMFTDGGATYCKAFTRWMQALDRSLPPKRTFAVGTSWGGLHAAIASAEVRSIRGYVSIAPVVRIERLPEFWMVRNDRCNQILYDGRVKRGLVLYGDSDDRAGSDLIAESVVETHAESVVYPGVGHETTVEALRRAGEWLDQRR